MTTNYGGPAFPAPNWHDNTPCGMTLRDYFAAKAMQGLLAGRVYNPGHAEQIAKDSKVIANAMIAARGDV